MTAALFYHPEAYTTGAAKLMGRHAAGASFVRGFIAHARLEAFWLQVERTEHAQRFAEQARALGRALPVKTIERRSLGALAEVGTVYYPGPGIGQHAWQRAAFGHGAWSLCGITHTTSSAGAMDALAELITAPVQPWDALICTSTAVKQHVEHLLQAQVDYLSDRLDMRRLVLPQRPVIPLGIHTQDFAFSAEQRRAARQALGLEAHSIAVLFMGRLSFHAKAHPLAVYQALEAAAQQTGQSVVLIECGWHANAFIEKAYAEAAALACPSVRVRTLDGRDAEARQRAWASADVFCSLSDNIQETFGIVPIEAMAAGLPVVVSDWDGYRDTVRDGVDGFRIPTLMPAGGLGGDLALRHALEIDTYDMYCGYSCSLVAVDVPAAAKAFARLFASPPLRRQMGEAGRARARAQYDWAVIIPQYEALWAALAERRGAGAKDLEPLPHPWPARMDPFHAFAGYPTQPLTADTPLSLAEAAADVAAGAIADGPAGATADGAAGATASASKAVPIGAAVAESADAAADAGAKTAAAAAALQRVNGYQGLAMVDFAKQILATPAEIAQVLAAAQSGPRPARELVAAVAPERQAFVFRSLAWLLKLGVLKLGADAGTGALATEQRPSEQPPP